MSLEKFFNYFWLAIVIICFILIGFSLVRASDQHITLGWDANTEKEVIGYDILHSFEKGGPYVCIGTNDGINNIEFAWYGIEPEIENYFVVVAFNSDGMESRYSNEVCGYLEEGKSYGIECGDTYDSGEGGSGGGCFINSL